MKLAATETFETITGPKTTIEPSASGLEAILSVTIGFMTIAGGITFVLWLITGAYTWITSAGQPDKLEKARNHMVNALVGLVVLIGALAISSIITSLLGLDIFNLADQISNLVPGNQ